MFIGWIYIINVAKTFHKWFVEYSCFNIATIVRTQFKNDIYTHLSTNYLKTENLPFENAYTKYITSILDIAISCLYKGSSIWLLTLKYGRIVDFIVNFFF